MASGPITSWQIAGGQVEAVTDFILGGSKITDHSHEIKTLAPRKESYDKPRKCIKKQRHHFANKGLYSQSYGFSSSHVWMWGEIWTIKKTEHQKINAFKWWCWRRLLTVPWTARSSNQSIRKEINREYSLEGLMLKLQYFDHLMGRANSLEKTLIPHAGKDWRQKEKGTVEDEMVR